MINHIISNETTSGVPCSAQSSAKACDQQGGHSRVRCIYPFIKGYIFEEQETLPCCAPWFKKSLGSLLKDDLDSVWNGDQFQQVRSEMYEGGDPSSFCSELCPIYTSGQWYDLDENPFKVRQSIIDDIRQGKTYMKRSPSIIELANDFKCNLSCIMCSSWQRGEGPGGSTVDALKKIEGHYDEIDQISMLYSGEIFARPDLIDYLANFDSEKYPDLTFSLMTNATMSIPEIWEKLSHINIVSVNVSIDAACAETYEEIRLKGKWNKLIENLKFLVGKQKEGVFDQMMINMTVMRQNVDQIAGFARMGIELGVTHVYFNQIFAVTDCLIMEDYNWAAMMKIEEQLADPVMSDPRVDSSRLREWWKRLPVNIDGPTSVADARKQIMNRFAVQIGVGITGCENDNIILDDWLYYSRKFGEGPADLLSWCRSLVDSTSLLAPDYSHEDFVRGIYVGMLGITEYRDYDISHWTNEVYTHGRRNILEQFFKLECFIKDRLTAFRPVNQQPYESVA
jgi:pyruvate-formate lyase-activating enzyme